MSGLLKRRTSSKFSVTASVAGASAAGSAISGAGSVHSASHGQSDAGERSWPVTADQYAVNYDDERAGTTSTVRVFSATCIVKDAIVCVKRCDLEAFDAEKISALMKDTAAMKSLKHPNIVSYYTSFVVGSEVWLVVELMEHGSLETVLKGQLRNGLDEAEVLAVLIPVLNALEYLHESNRIHRNIKTKHIMLNAVGDVKLSNFSMSTWLEEQGRSHSNTLIGTLAWMAPEVAELSLSAQSSTRTQRGYNSAADIWSLGITAIELATGSAPYHQFKNEPMKVIKLILQSPPPIGALADTAKWSTGMRDFVSQCLQKDPEKRPSATKLLKMPVFKSIKKKQNEIRASFAARIEPFSKRAESIMRERTKVQPDLRTLGEMLSGVGSGSTTPEVGSSHESLPSAAAVLGTDGAVAAAAAAAAAATAAAANAKSENERKSGSAIASQSAAHTRPVTPPPVAHGEPPVTPRRSSEWIFDSDRPAVSLNKLALDHKTEASENTTTSEDQSGETEDQTVLGGAGVCTIPLDCWIGEDDESYVVYLRTIAGTPLSFRLHGNTLQITGTLPELPTLPGVKLLQPYEPVFQHDLTFASPIDKSGVGKPAMIKHTMVITLPKIKNLER